MKRLKYVDDIVLLGESCLDVAIVLSTLVRETQVTKLQINFKMSMMINIFQGNEPPYKGNWRVEVANGKPHDVTK